jgi:hypothetical protein
MAKNDLETEARTLLRYLTGCDPARAIVDRYIASVSQSVDSVPMALPGPIRRFPFLLRFGDPLLGRLRMNRRLKIASILAEGSPEGITVFFPVEKRSAARTVAGILWLGLVEGILLAPRLVASTWLRIIEQYGAAGR